MSVTLPLSNVINVSVIVSPAAVPGLSFNQALVVGPTSVIPSTERTRLYQTLTAMQQDGFQVTDPEYIAAELYFGQQPSPTFLWVGRQDLTAIKTVAIGGAAGTGYVAGDIVTVVQSGGSGGQVKVLTVASGVPTAVQVVSGGQGTGYSTGTNLATTGGTGTGLEINITAIGETALQAVTYCRAQNPQWYICMFVGTAVDQDHLDIAAFIEAANPASVYFLTTGEASVLNNVPGNLLALLQGEKYRRTFSVYSTTQGGAAPHNAYACAAPMGMAMGRNTGATASYFDLMFKVISGVLWEPLTQTQVETICGSVDRSSPGLNGNAVVNFANGAYIWLQPAIMASGDFFDEILFLDMLANQIQVAGVTLLTSVNALPITEGGMTLMKNVISDVCATFKDIGFIAPSGFWSGLPIGSGNGSLQTGQALSNGFFVYSRPVAQMSPSQRAARVMPAVNVALIESQSGHYLSVTVNVQR